ncbi:hypothetical protein BCR35DRAFT_313094 [Leucosporidium creatinivorum]|uniref:Extracellular membrane protein CFEM domain-containing protein n=1 Tax=Leucosporidium creatinivorum TaxID=106004 RepID=A0A1Y2FX23_9BASI|nr:hypothetical protein BCR35DRAFT_313094 [Leucosporidium creatinivorum]
MSRYIALLALSSAVLALPTPSTSFPGIGTSLTHAFELKAARVALVKRQSTQDGLDGLENLLQEGLYNSACEQQCYPWIQEITDCVNDNVSNVAIGQCACRSTPVKAMKICGICVGDEGIKNADDFDAVCSAAGSGYGSGSSGSSGSASGSVASATGSSFGSASRAASSAFASGTAFASRTAAAAPSSSSSSSSSSENDSSTSNTPDDNAFSAGTGDSPTVTVTSPASGATTPASGAVKVVGSAALAMAGVVAAILM